MKYSILVIALFLAAASISLAQKAPGKSQIGFTGGPSHTFYRGSDPYTNYKGDIRGAVGFSFKHYLNRFFLKGDLLYENKGAAYMTFDFTDPLFRTDFRNLEKTNRASRQLHFITLPILVGFPIQQTGFFVNAGPYVGWKMRVTISYEKGYPNHTKPEDRLDFGIVGGIGYSRPISPAIEISGEIRHNYGLYNVDDTRPNEKYASSTALLIGIHYLLGSK